VAKYIRTYTNFSGGQNNFSGPQASPIILDTGGLEALYYAHSAQNWEMAENGLLKYAGDDDVITSPAVAVTTGEYDWNGVHILCKGTKIYTVSGSTETEIYPLAGTPQTAGAYYQFTEWDDGAGTEILLIMNGTDPVLEYDGSTCVRTTFTDDPSVIWNDARPQGAMVFGGNIFFWGPPTHPHRFYKPRPGTHNNFDDAENTVEAADVDAGFGGVITGMQALTDDIAVIYKERAIRRMSGVNPFGSEVEPISIRPITDEFGCIAPRSIVQVGLEQYFFSEDGLRRFRPVQSYGDIDPEQPTYPIQEVIDALNFSSNVIVNACAVFHKPSKQIWLSVPYGAATTNNLIIIHDVVTGGNDLLAVDDVKASVLATFNRKIYHGDYDGQIYKHGDDYNYHGTAVDAEWESKWIAHNSLGLRKIYRELHIYAESDGEGSLICQYTTLQRGETRAQSTTSEISSGDNAWDTAVWDTAVWGSSEENIFKIEDLGEGNAIKLKFTNNANNQRVKIRMVELHYDIINSSRG
jgi:hypothetical protein